MISKMYGLEIVLDRYIGELYHNHHFLKFKWWQRPFHRMAKGIWLTSNIHKPASFIIGERLLVNSAMYHRLGLPNQSFIRQQFGFGT